jgi:membrane associated rhomboid family serine protease
MNGFFTAPTFWDWFRQAKLLIDLLLIAWAVAIVDFVLLPGVMRQLCGLRPRQLGGIPGIMLSPLVHGDWQHLLNNSAYYLIFGGMIVMRDAADLPVVTLTIALIGGVITWVVGRYGRYVGASGVVFGYIGFALALVYLYKDPLATMFFVVILLSFFFGDILVFPMLTGDRAWVFGRTLWGLFPQTDAQIAWEGHLFGFLGGIWTAMHLNDLHNFFKPLFDWLPTFIQWT